MKNILPMAAMFSFLLAGSAAGGGEPLLEQTWQRYHELFRSPREIMLGISTELKDPDRPLRLQQAADLLRSFPNVEEVFPILPNPGAEQETMIIFQMLNAPPAEFGAWLEKLQPRHIRQAIRRFIQAGRGGLQPRDPCEDPDPLHLKNFYQLPGSIPFFKQPLPAGLYVRLRPDLSSAGHSRTWTQQAERLEDEVRRFYERSGWNASIVRYQWVPPSEPEAGPLLTAFWLAMSLAGTGASFCFSRRFGPFLALLVLMAACHLALDQLAGWLPHLFDRLLFPAGLLLTLFWGLTFYWRAHREECHCAGWPGFLARWRQSIMLLLLLGLAVPLACQQIRKHEPGNPRRPVLEQFWSLKSDHAWEERTACLLTEASGWGDIVYELGAERFAFSKAKENRLVTRYWNPGAWVPRPVFQRSNASDFLKKRNVVVLEKIARQEKLAPKDLAPTFEFLNRIGEASLALTQDESAVWVLSRESNALGVRFRQWIRVEPESIATLSYCFRAPRVSETALMPWIGEAVRPFGVQARWVAPKILHQAAIRDMLLKMAGVSGALLALVLLARGRRIRVLRAALSTFLFLAGWVLSLIALSWDWTGGGLWIWTSVAAWQAALCLEFFSGDHEADREVVFAAATVAGMTILAAAWLWSLSGKSEGCAALLGTGYFWSLAWCLALAPQRHKR